MSSISLHILKIELRSTIGNDYRWENIVTIDIISLAEEVLVSGQKNLYSYSQYTKVKHDSILIVVHLHIGFHTIF